MLLNLLCVIVYMQLILVKGVHQDFYNIKENMTLVNLPKTKRVPRSQLSDIGCAMSCLSLKSCSTASYTHNINKCVLGISSSCEYKMRPEVGTVTLLKGPPKCEIGWDKFGKHCYRFGTGSNSWRNAQDECQKNGANLVKIEDQKENEWIKEKGNRMSLWIGLNDHAVEGQWRWISDNSLIDFEGWHSLAPNVGSNVNCCHLWFWDNEYGWDDTHCSESNKGYICEKEVLI